LVLSTQQDDGERDEARIVAADCRRWIEEHSKVVLDLETAISAQEAEAEARRKEYEASAPGVGDTLVAQRTMRAPLAIVRCALPDCDTEQAVDVVDLLNRFLTSIGWTADSDGPGHRGTAICPHCAAGGVAECDLCGHREKIGAESTPEAMVVLDKRGWRRLGPGTLGLICVNCEPPGKPAVASLLDGLEMDEG
jgi:hypothetical protein